MARPAPKPGRLIAPDWPSGYKAAGAARDERPMSVTSGAKRKRAASVNSSVSSSTPASSRWSSALPVPAVQHSVRLDEATLLVGDYLFVSKYFLRLQPFLAALSPNLFSGRIGDFAQADRGDIVVFPTCRRKLDRLIKRVIDSRATRSR